jgi:ubiquinone/menaquinone biosynthesis C-methylase UbiE
LNAGLADEYKRQFGWRSWPAVFDALPPLEGRTVLDLGCAIGDQAAAMAARGARVIGFDANEALLSAARSRGIPDAEFRAGDLRRLPGLGVEADGIWCSFAAAYIPDLFPVLVDWTRRLTRNGWIALTEVDDLFGHEPLSSRAKELFASHAREALEAGRYDFHMGRKLRGYLERAGFTVVKTLTLEDRELSFAGPAHPEVVDAWRDRFDRMPLLQTRFAEAFEPVSDEFLACLGRRDHVSTARVLCCIAESAMMSAR